MAERRYAETHEWVSIDGTEATIGISQFAVDQLGDIVYLDLVDAGKELNAGEALGDIESVKAVSQLYAPVSGRLTEVNPALEGNPELVNQSPLRDGWMVKMQVEQENEFQELMSQEKYDSFVAEQG